MSLLLKSSLLPSRGKSSTCIKIDLSLKDHPPGLSHLLMNNFKDLPLSQEEKKDLSTQQRELLWRFKSLRSQEITKAVELLEKKIKKYGDKNICITSSDLSTFICLAYIFSNPVTPCKSLTFELAWAPLVLFPKKLICKKIKSDKSIHISFQEEDSTWMKFESLCHDKSVLQPLIKSKILVPKKDLLKKVA